MFSQCHNPRLGLSLGITNSGMRLPLFASGWLLDCLLRSFRCDFILLSVLMIIHDCWFLVLEQINHRVAYDSTIDCCIISFKHRFSYF